MIQINLLPDVKRELIKAKRTRSVVILSAIITGIVALSITILLSLYHFGVQNLRSNVVSDDITKKTAKLKAEEDIENMLTIQSQLKTIQEKHDAKAVSSRIFQLLAAIAPVDPNKVVISSVKLNTTDNTIRIEAQASNGFVAADVFKKSIAEVKYTYASKEKIDPIAVASNISLTNFSYGEDASGKRVLRFSVDFTYDRQLMSWATKNVTVGQLEKMDATDSRQYLPLSLFGNRATDIEGAKQ